MHVYVVLAHPSKRSFSRKVTEAFTQGLDAAGHSYEVQDLYAGAFQSEMDESEYLRETSGNPDLPIPPDVAAEQERLNRARGLVLIYPLWWSDCPAKLKGWFDRVWTYGYAYMYDQTGARSTQVTIEKALVLCSAGHTAAHLEETGIAGSMRQIMLQDRLLGVGVKHARMEILGGMMPFDDSARDTNLRKAFELGRAYFSPFDLQPTLVGERVTLRPLTANDLEALAAAASDPLIWEQHPDPLRYRRDVFERDFFAKAVASRSAFVITENATGAVIGSSRYYDWDPAAREIAIGYTFLARGHWGGPVNREVKHLMLRHAFTWAAVVWFHIGSGNVRSRRAIEKIGARFSHEVIRLINGTEHPHACYRIDAASWPGADGRHPRP